MIFYWVHNFMIYSFCFRLKMSIARLIVIAITLGHFISTSSQEELYKVPGELVTCVLL